MDLDPTIPIWLQLTAEFERRIVTNEWPPGQRIPAVREIASEIAVNPNTVQKALSELERKGLCMSQRTAGRFVTEDEDLISRTRDDLATTTLHDFIGLLKGLNITKPKALELLESHWEELA